MLRINTIFNISKTHRKMSKRQLIPTTPADLPALDITHKTKKHSCAEQSKVEEFQRSPDYLRLLEKAADFQTMLDHKREINIKLRFELSAAWVWKIQLWDLPRQQCRKYRILIHRSQESGPCVPLHLGHLLGYVPSTQRRGLGFSPRTLFFNWSEKGIVRDSQTRCSPGGPRSGAATPHQRAPTWKACL